MKLSHEEYQQDNLKDTNWLGEVVDIDDPLKMGRIKVKVFGKFDTMPITEIPWAYPSNNFTGGSETGGGMYSIPKKQSYVNVNFDNGNLYHPEYTFIQKISDELKTEIGDDYLNFHSLIYDTVLEDGLKIYYSENADKGLFINLKNTIINIRNDNEIKITNPNGDIVSLKNDGTLEITTSDTITINATNKCVINTQDAEINADNSAIIKTNTATVNAQEINLGDGASEAIIKGNAFMTYFNTHMHTGNLGAPVSPPTAPMTPAMLSTISKTK